VVDGGAVVLGQKIDPMRVSMAGTTFHRS
jgi:hypothetical protein